jgi:hypothetical protein
MIYMCNEFEYELLCECLMKMKQKEEQKKLEEPIQVSVN